MIYDMISLKILGNVTLGATVIEREFPLSEFWQKSVLDLCTCIKVPAEDCAVCNI